MAASVDRARACAVRGQKHAITGPSERTRISVAATTKPVESEIEKKSKQMTIRKT